MAETTKKPMSFDEACELNIQGFTGLSPVNSTMWFALLTDLAESLFTWEGNGLDFYDRLLIERFINQKKVFCMVRPKYRVENAIVTGKLRIVNCIPVDYGQRNIVTRVRLVMERPKQNLIEEYDYNEFVLFDNFSLTHPQALIQKYSQILGKLDALYDQNVDKLGVPIIALCNKTMKNELLNLFKRTKLNALFSLVTPDRDRSKTTELFYDPKIDFLLDKINTERQAIMKEFLQELGVNPNDEVGQSTHYVNTTAIKESSLIAKYFSASMNKYRDNFCDKCNERFQELNLNYYTTVKTYQEEDVNNDQNTEI